MLLRSLTDAPTLPVLTPRLSVRVIRPFALLVQQFGGFSREHLFNKLLEMPLDERVPLTEALEWLEGGSQGLGLRALQFVERGNFDVTEYLAASASTWGEALKLLARYARILHEAADYSLHDLASRSLFELRSRVPLNRAASEFQAGLVALAARTWLGHLDSFEFCFAHEAPRDPSGYHAVFGRKVRFNAPCDAVLFDAALLNAPLLGANPHLHTVLRRHADHLLASVPELEWLTGRVRQLVMELLPEGKTDIRYATAKLKMSRRTLGRHLKREGTTYRDLVESARHELACQYLLIPKLDVKQIALLLGYSETTAFSRAFKRWCGQSPIEYRRSRYAMAEA